jgi:diguanylate cyclase (GGDEF)-like protein
MAVAAHRAHSRLRLARGLIAIGLLLGIVYGLLVMVNEVVSGGNGLPPLSPLNLLVVLLMPFCLAGVLAYPVTVGRVGSGIRSLLDASVASVAVFYIFYEFGLRSIASLQTVQRDRVIDRFFFTALSVVILAVCVGVLLRVDRQTRPELVYVTVALILIALPDLLSTVALASGATPSNDSWAPLFNAAILGLLVLGSGVFAGGAYSALHHSRDEEPPVVAGADVRGLHRDLRRVTLIPVAAAAAVALALALLRPAVDAPGTAMLATVIVLLVLRELVGARDRNTIASAMEEREELFRSLVEESSDLVCLIDYRATIVYAGPSLASTVGVSDAALIGTSMSGLVKHEHRRRLLAAVVAAGGGADARHDVEIHPPEPAASPGPGTATEVYAQWQVSDGSWRWMHTRMRDLVGSRIVTGIVCNTRDVESELVARQDLEFGAYHDALTGLPNLTLIRTQLSPRNFGSEAPVELVLAGLDRFRDVNDTFGHTLGDALLRGVAERLNRRVRSRATLGRISGDTFVAVVDPGSDSAAVAGLVHECLTQPIQVGDLTLNPRISVGTATSRHASTPDELLRNADLAMNQAKLAGGNQIVSYEPWMHERTARALTVHEGLRGALLGNHLQVAYQSVVSLPNGELESAEALVRWTDPQLGVVSPAEFIPVAEASGLVAEIDMWVLEHVCAQIARWRSDGLRPPRINVNVSRRELGPHLPTGIAAVLDRFGLEPGAIGIELTESAISSDTASAVAILAELRAHGHLISLDDFGTGQSSLSQLASVPLDYVKIDRSFVLPLPGDPRSTRLMESIVRMCQDLALPIIAEGVETAEVAAMLASAGVQQAQGYHFARPVPPEEFEALLVTADPR